ncbi:MAG: hypothetical protein ACRDPR_13290 [Nocardioidaceae bacterium]
MALADVQGTGTTPFTVDKVNAAATLTQLDANGAAVRRIDVPLRPTGLGGGEEARFGAPVPDGFATNGPNGSSVGRPVGRAAAGARRPAA